MSQQSSMPVQKMLEVLSHVLARQFPRPYFQQNNVAECAFAMSAPAFNRKLREPLTERDHHRLLSYFGLPHEALIIFRARDEKTFYAELANLRIGSFSENIADQLAQRCTELAQKSESKLRFLCDGRGFIGPDNIVESDAMYLQPGDTGFVEFRFDNETLDGALFVLIDFHVASSSVRLINPVFDESRIQLRNGCVRYPESIPLHFDETSKPGSHMLAAFAVNRAMADEIRNQMSILLRLYNKRDSTDVPNKFNGYLTPASLDAIEKVSRSGMLDVAVFRYYLFGPAQQP